MHGDDLEKARQAWRLRGQTRPAWALEPAPGQESVWDYPRPPVVVPDTRLVRVRWQGVLIAETRAARRVLETASPPTFYLPPTAVAMQYLRPEAGHSFCEWKGQAHYFSIVAGDRCAENAAWSYPDPFEAFSEIRDYLAFYPGQCECRVDGEAVRAQAGGFYGGWITDEIVGPFKGEPGSGDW